MTIFCGSLHGRSSAGNIDADPTRAAPQQSGLHCMGFSATLAADRMEYIKRRKNDEFIDENEQERGAQWPADKRAASGGQPRRSLLVSAAAGSGKRRVLVEALFPTSGARARISAIPHRTYTRAARQRQPQQNLPKALTERMEL